MSLHSVVFINNIYESNYKDLVEIALNSDEIECIVKLWFLSLLSIIIDSDEKHVEFVGFFHSYGSWFGALATSKNRLWWQHSIEVTNFLTTLKCQSHCNVDLSHQRVTKPIFHFSSPLRQSTVNTDTLFINFAFVSTTDKRPPMIPVHQSKAIQRINAIYNTWRFTHFVASNKILKAFGSVITNNIHA